VSLLACNALALIGRYVEQAHQHPPEPPLQVSVFHLALSIKSGYEGTLIAVPPEHRTEVAGFVETAFRFR